MKATLAATAVTAAALLIATPGAHADTVAGQKPTGTAFSYNNINFGFTNGGLRICVSGAPEQGSGQFAVENLATGVDPDYLLTPVLNPNGNAGANDPINTCWDFNLHAGSYRITPGKYLSARCLKTANGRIVQQPTQANPSGLQFSDARCHALVHHFHTGHADMTDRDGDGNPDQSTLEVPEVTVDVDNAKVTTIFAHVVPDNYPECTVSGNPAANPNRRCEPTGPTG